MIEDIIILDDVIPTHLQDKIEDLFTSSRLPWVFFKDIAIPPAEIKRLGITKLTPGIACYIKQDNPKFANEQLFLGSMHGTHHRYDKRSDLSLEDLWRHLVPDRMPSQMRIKLHLQCLPYQSLQF